jgi:hypothetical protein
VFDYSAGFDQNAADLEASLTDAGDSASAPSGHPHLDVLYTADDWSIQEGIRASSAGNLHGQDSTAILWHDVATPLLGSVEGHADLFAHKDHTPAFAFPGHHDLT